MDQIVCLPPIQFEWSPYPVLAYLLGKLGGHLMPPSGIRPQKTGLFEKINKKKKTNHNLKWFFLNGIRPQKQVCLKKKKKKEKEA
jgi:hypothetical protein